MWERLKPPPTVKLSADETRLTEYSREAGASLTRFPIRRLRTGRLAGITERDGGCPPVPSVFDNYRHIFIHQTFRTGLQTPSGHRNPSGHRAFFLT